MMASSPRIARDIVITLTFHQGIFETPGSRDGHREGWEETFEKLAAFVANTATTRSIA